MERNLVSILLVDETGKILLGKRSQDRIFGGMWSFFGGGIEPGETPLEAAIRESKEEMNYDLSNPSLIDTREFVTDLLSGTSYVFLAKYDPSQNIVHDTNEISKVGWYNPSDANSLEMPLVSKEILKVVENYLKLF